MGVRVLRGAAARPGGDPALAGWADLAEACPWSTPYGCPQLTEAWYEAFERLYEPVVLYEPALGGGLDGLLALAEDRQTQAIVPAVHDDASVYGWLARPLRGSYFLERALAVLGARYPAATLELEALPDRAPTDWLARARPVGRIARVESAHHWRARLDPARAKKKLDKRANSQALAGLKKQGELRFEPELDAPTLERLVPDLVRWYDGYAEENGRTSRFLHRPEEIRFWRRLAGRAPGFMASALWVGERPAAVVFGFRIRGRFHVAWGVENPAFETQAPSQILWLMLEADLLERGLVDADVTCGFDWMRQGASEAQDTVKVSILFDDRARWAHDLGQSMVRASRVALRLIDR